MTKIQLIEIINKRLPKKMLPQMMAMYIGQAFNELLFPLFRANISNLDLFTKTYSDVNVDYDSAQDVYYSTLPVAIVQLPVAGEGVRDIRLMKEKGIKFVPMTTVAMSILNDESITSVIGYCIRNNRIEYDSKLSTNSLLLMRIVRPFEAIDEDEQVYIPAGMNEKLIEMVLSLALGIPVDKMTNDNSDKTK